MAAGLAFLAGVFIVQQLSALPPWWAWLAWMPFAPVLWRKRWRWLMFLFLGMTWCAWRAALVLQMQLPAELEAVDLAVEGRVVGLPARNYDHLRFDFDVARVEVGGRQRDLPLRVRLRTRDPAFPAAPGERWRLSVRLKRAHGFQNPGGFDYEGKLFREGIRATGYLKSGAVHERQADGGWRGSLDRLRMAARDFMQEVLAESPSGPVITALAVGDSGAVRDEQWDVLRATGTLHLVSISGLHVGMVAGLAYWLAAFLWRQVPGFTLRIAAPRMGALAGWLAGGLYSALAGFAVPTQRTWIMLTVALGAVWLKRPVHGPPVLAAALLAVLLYDPLAAMEIGFWLSFAAVAAIILAVRGVGPDIGRVGSATASQLGVTLGLAPLLLLYFQQLSLVSPLANAFAIPWVSLGVVPVTLAGTGFWLAGAEAPATLLLSLAARMHDWVWPALEYLAGIPHAVLTAPAPAGWPLVCALIGIALALMPRGLPGRWLAAIGFLPLFFAPRSAPGPGEIWFTVLDVGQGSAAVVRSAGYTLLFDTGGSYGPDYDAGEAVVLPYLLSQGIRRLDAIVVSHPDRDHAGGEASVVRAYPAAARFRSDPVPGDPAHNCRERHAWQADGVRFEFLSTGTSAGKSNDASCVLKVTGRHGAVLLPADIEAETEGRLLHHWGGELAADVLLVPHHGSKTSSTPPFLDAVQPLLAVASAGYRNRFGHPHPTVRARYAERGIPMPTTAEGGAITVRMGAGGPEVEAWRIAARRFWHAPTDAGIAAGDMDGL